MSDCTNLELRDLLPDLARGALSEPARSALEAHLVTCEACRAELEVIRKAYAALSVGPAVDVSRIAAAVARSTALRREATISATQRRRRRGWSMATPTRRTWLAAASIAAIAGAAILASNVDRYPESSGVPPVGVHIEQPTTPAPVQSDPLPTPPSRPASGAELVMGGGVSDLADADLESLLEVLENVDTHVDVEPATLLPVLEGDV